MKSSVYPCFTVIFLIAAILSGHHLYASANPRHSLSVRNPPLCSWEAPRNMQFSEVTPTTVTVSWDHPEQGIAPGGYQVRVMLTATGQIVHTRKVPGLSYTIPNLLMGTEYTIELRSICTGGEVSDQLTSGGAITVYVDEIINTDCPETSETYTPLGTFYSGTINSSNPWDDITALPFAADGTNNRIYYWYFRNTNANKYARCIIEMDKPEGYDYHYHYKDIDNNSGWYSFFYDPDKSVRVSTSGGNLIAIITFLDNKFRVTRHNGANFSLKIDETCVCNSNSTNPSCIYGTALTTDVDTQNKELDSEIEITNKDHDSLGPLMIFPNPAGDKVFVYVYEKQISTITIFDLNGKKLIEKDIFYSLLMGDLSISVDITELNPGMYIITCVSANRKQMGKFIKQ